MGANDKVDATFHPHHPMDSEPYPIKEKYADDDKSPLAQAYRGIPPWGSRLKERAPGIYTSDEFEATRRLHPIEKLTAPPETVEQHLERIGVYWWEHDGIMMVELSTLRAAEHPEEGQDGK